LGSAGFFFGVPRVGLGEREARGNHRGLVRRRRELLLQRSQARGGVGVGGLQRRHVLRGHGVCLSGEGGSGVVDQNTTKKNEGRNSLQSYTYKK
jgi:hypothetical protein